MNHATGSSVTIFQWVLLVGDMNCVQLSAFLLSIAGISIKKGSRFVGTVEVITTIYSTHLKLSKEKKLLAFMKHYSRSQLLNKV